jgi:hypothetical protein
MCSHIHSGNVPLLGDTRSHVMASVHEIRSWINNFIGCNEGWLTCLSSTIVVDELVVERGVEMGIQNSVVIFSPHNG